MLQYFLKRSLHSLAVCICCFLFNMITLETYAKTSAQSNSSRWEDVKELSVTITIEIFDYDTVKEFTLNESYERAQYYEYRR